MRTAVALAGAALLAACASNAEPASQLAGAHYVAMGSSFAAGAGIGPDKPGSPARCHRATVNYASLLADRLDMDLADQSCGGATTSHILQPWNELPAQLDAIDADTRLVTITIGGNDLNYMGLLFTASCGGRQDCPPRVHLPQADAYRQLRDNLVDIVNQIRGRAPQAKVVFVQYVTLVPEQPCDAAPIDPTGRTEARQLAANLARITAEAAQETGASVLPIDTLSAGHTACDAEPWSRGNVADYDGAEGAPWHPTAAGHAAIAAMLAEMLKAPAS